MKAKFKYIRNLHEGGKSAEMFIYDQIGDDFVNGVQFAYEMRYLIDYEGAQNIKVRINCPGGDVRNSLSIFSAILNANNSGKVQVDTYNDGVAASSGGWILLAGKNVYTKDYARIMVHGVSANPKDENEKEAVRQLSDMVRQVLVNRTGKTSEYIENLMSNGRDNWFNVDQAVAEGFIQPENVEHTGRSLNVSANEDRMALAVANKAAEYLNEVKTKPLAMKKVIAKLGLQEAANEDAVYNAVVSVLDAKTEAQNSLTTVQNELTEAKNKIQELEGKLGETNKAAALAAVENAIKTGKFAPKDKDAKDALIAQAENNLEGFNAMVGMMPTKAANIMAGVQTGADEAEGVIAKVNNRGLRDLEKEDPRLLAEIRNNHREEYVKLYNKAYGTQKTEAELY